MNLLFLVPPNLEGLNVLRDSVYGCWCKGNRLGGATAPPHPLILMATCLRRAGHRVTVLDGLMDPGAPQRLQELAPDLDGVVIQTSVMAFLDDCEVLAWIKELNPAIQTMVCGSMPTFLPEKSLEQPAVDYVILGEPELVLVELCDALAAGRSPEGMVGVGYRREGRPVHGGRAPLIQDLDSLPRADWSLLDHGQVYFNPIIKRYPYVTELTTRGCYAKCVFCMSPGFYGGKIRGNSAGYVLEGLREHRARGVREIYFRDEMFTSLRDRNRRIYETMIAERMDLTWICSSRVNAVNEADLRMMKKAGCHWIKFGVESGSQAILDGMKKSITLDQVRETFRLCRQVGIRTHAHFMIGNVGETAETARQTIAFAQEIRPTTATFGMLSVYPGTPIWDQVYRDHPEILDKFDLRLKDLHSKSFFTDALTHLSKEELEKAVKAAHRSFYLRPGYLAGQVLSIRNWQQVKSLARAGWRVIDYALRGHD